MAAKEEEEEEDLAVGVFVKKLRSERCAPPPDFGVALGALESGLGVFAGLVDMVWPYARYVCVGFELRWWRR